MIDVKEIVLNYEKFIHVCCGELLNTLIVYNFEILVEAMKNLENPYGWIPGSNIDLSISIDDLILKSINKTGCVVTAEEHNYLGGLGESVARVLVKNNPAPQEFIATNDTFGESGKPQQLMEKYGLNYKSIVESSIKVIERKNN